MPWRVCRASLASRRREHPSPPSWDGQNWLWTLPKALGAQPGHPGPWLSLAQPVRVPRVTSWVRAQGGLITDGPGWRGRAGGRPGAQSRLGTEGGKAPVTWGPRHCQGPGSALGWDPDPEGRRRSECPASEMWHRGAQQPGWRASWEVHSGRRALGGQALGPSASVSLHLSLGDTVRVRVHPPTEEGRGAARAPAITAPCRPGTLPLGTAPSAKGPCPGPHLLAEAWKPISGRQGLHPFFPVSLARGLSCMQSALNACRNELQGLFSTWSHWLSCNSVLLQRWTVPSVPPAVPSHVAPA